MRIRSSRLKLSRIVALGMLEILLAGTVPGQGSTAASPDQITADLQGRAKHYLDFRKQVAGSTPKSNSTPSKITSAQNDLADKIRVARAGAALQA